jgi:5-methyltetrahydrofolate--homocysteine methyltransferase
MDFKNYLNDNIVIFDGAMGTMLQNAVKKPGELLDTYSILHPEVVLNIHEQYVEAGADVITTNTFQSNELSLREYPYSVEEVICQGVNLAKESGAKWVALDIGPLGHSIEPEDTASFKRAYEIFKRQIIAGSAAGADLVIIETFSDLNEVKAAVLAAKENCSLPVLCTMTFQKDGRTLGGTDPKTVTRVLQGLEVDALGVNCSFGPRALLPVVDEMLKYSRIPVIAQPNAGLPANINGKMVYDITPDEFANYMRTMAEHGVKIIGGCCGTSPEFIKRVRSVLINLLV